VVDELDLVRQVYNAEPISSHPAHRQTIRDRVLAEIAAAKPICPASAPGPSAGAAPRRPRRRRIIAAAVVLPTAGLLAAAGWTLATIRQAAQVTGSIGCYASPSLHSSINVINSTGTSPVALCAQQWQAGTVAGPVKVTPSLAACVLPKGNVIGVFPDTTCAKLHLQPLPPGYASAAKNFAAMRNQLVSELGESGNTTCVSETKALSLVRSALHTYGYTAWKVTTNGFGSFTPDPEHHQIVVVGEETPAFASAINSATEAQRASCKPGDPPERAAAAETLFHQALKTAGYGNWTVTASPGVTTRQQPCYGASVNASTHTVSLGFSMAMYPLP
jgi:hypothetical protein